MKLTSQSWWLILSVGVCLSWAVCYLWYPAAQLNTGSDDDEPVIERAERVEEPFVLVIEGSFEVLRQRARRRIPLATLCKRCEIFQNWPVVKERRWTPAYLAQQVDEDAINARVQQRGREFVYQRPAERLPFGEQVIAQIEQLPEVVAYRYAHRAGTERRRLSPAEFFARLTAPESSEVYYLACDIETFATAAARDFGEIPEQVWMTTENRNNPLWFGGADAVARRHWDAVTNVYLQLYGNKTFCLDPPSVNYPSYPFFHPGYRQESTEKSVPRGSCVQLEVGDALYVPPFAWHWVRADTPSISVSFFTTEAELIDEELLGLPIPFEESWTPIQMIAALAQYMDSCWLPIRAWMISWRYQPVFGTADCRLKENICPPVDLGRTPAELQIAFQRGWEQVRSMLERYQLAGEPAIERLVLATYLDKLMIYFVDHPALINAFVQCC